MEYHHIWKGNIRQEAPLAKTKQAFFKKKKEQWLGLEPKTVDPNMDLAELELVI